MKISVNLTQQNSEFIANCPELDINCYAPNKEDAVRRMQSIINFYVESAKELGLEVESFTEMVIDGKQTKELLCEKLPSTARSLLN